MFGDEAPPSVVKLANALGFDVELVSMTASERGRLVRDPFASNGFRIEVNDADDVCTRRWTVLHEIAHGLLHANDDLLAAPKYRAGYMHFYDADERRNEREANAFAEALVFGDGALEGALGLYGQDREKLAKHFGVTPKTLSIALQKRFERW
jgi:Zn-dependent peptidase ImmA (M78 family)